MRPDDVRNIRAGKEAFDLAEIAVGNLRRPVVQQMPVEARAAESACHDTRTEHPVDLAMRNFGNIRRDARRFVAVFEDLAHSPEEREHDDEPERPGSRQRPTARPRRAKGNRPVQQNPL